MTSTVILAHGASGTAASMQPFVEALQRRGVEAMAIDLPRHGRSPVKAELAVPAFLHAASGRAHVVGGGQSYGGRVASLAALQAAFTGLLLLCYPLHRPGHPDAEARTAHWPAIRCPVLLLSGEQDPFARLDLLKHAVRRLPRGELVTYPGIGHGLRPVLEDAMERTAAFVRSLP